MSRILLALALATFVAACDSANPFQGGDDEETGEPGDTPIIDDGEEVTTDGIPEALSDDLRSVAFDPTAGTLSVDMAALDRADTDIPLADYIPNPALATPEMTAQGYQTFSYQDDALDRMFIAIVAQSPDGSVVGAVVLDGGQFSKFFSGGFYATDGNYTPGNPENDTGLVEYAGTYAALTNLDAVGNELLPLPPGTADAIRPDQSAQVVGDILFNVNFQTNQINGAIYNRAFVNLSPVFAGAFDGSNLQDVNLIPTTITDAGTFFGTAENPEQEGIGNYGGTFGGTEGAGVAGTTNLNGDWIPEIDNEIEFGVFVLTQCGLPDDDALCDTIPVNP